MEKEIFESIREILTNEENVKVEGLKLESNLKTDLGLDSLDVVELLMELEKKYMIHIQDSDVTKMNTINDIINVVVKSINSK